MILDIGIIQCYQLILAHRLHIAIRRIHDKNAQTGNIHSIYPIVLQLRHHPAGIHNIAVCCRKQHIPDLLAAHIGKSLLYQSSGSGNKGRRHRGSIFIDIQLLIRRIIGICRINNRSRRRQGSILRIFRQIRPIS